MATTSPSPANPPATTTIPPPPATSSNSSTPQPSAVAPPPSTPKQPNADPPDTSTPSTPSAPPQISPPPPESSVSPPQPPTASPPPTVDPPPATSPPSPSNPSDPPTAPPPASNSTPPSSSPPPTSSPPPISPSPPEASPLPPTRATSPSNSPPPPSVVPPPKSSPPPPPTANPPRNNSPPPPETITPSPRDPSPPPPSSPSPPTSQPPPSSSNSTRSSPPPPVVIRLSPPPPIFSPPSPAIVNNTTPITPDSANTTGNGVDAGVIAGVAVGVGFLMLSLLGFIIWCLRKRRNDDRRLNGGYIMPSPMGSSRSDSIFTKTPATTAPLIGGGSITSSSDLVYSPTDPGGGLGNSRAWFSFEELFRATNGFLPQTLLGEGGFGSVYKGCLPDGREIAVKQLKIDGGQGEREFKAEVDIISRIHHRHLVSLVGYCISDSRRLLVYDYVPNNTLYFHLHGKGEQRPLLDWEKRVKIAAGAARGIAYLHEDCHPRIIHRDIKSSNILLDNNFEAKVSDFGLAKLALDANTHVTTRVMGTFGYMAPEYATSGKLTEKSDVFSYGVVLLELITGRKPVDSSQPLGDESLVEWARPLISHALETEEIEGLVDPRLEKNYVDSEMFRMIEAAAACVRHSAFKRPKMSQVVRAFESFATADLSNGMRVGESEIFNPGQQSAEIRWFRRMAFGDQNFSSDFFSQSNFGGHDHSVNISADESGRQK